MNILPSITVSFNNRLLKKKKYFFLTSSKFIHRLFNEHQVWLYDKEISGILGVVGKRSGNAIHCYNKGLQCTT